MQAELNEPRGSAAIRIMVTLSSNSRPHSCASHDVPRLIHF